MSHERDEQLSENLLALLGEEDFVRLVEWRGGTRLYVSERDVSTIAAALGDDVASKLAARYGNTIISVPLARALRARKYRQASLSNAEIALKLGITERGVDRLFKRMPAPPRRPKKVDPRQLKLFG